MTTRRTTSTFLSVVLFLMTFGNSSAKNLFATAFLSFDTGEYARAVAIADLNADGVPDLAVADYVSNTVSVLLGNGDGTFRPRTDYPTGRGPHSIAIGDLNGDGKPDIATANARDFPQPDYTGTVSVLLGNGDGTFASGAEFLAGITPTSIAIRDLNGDGRSDIALVNSYENQLSVFLGNCDGTLGPRAVIATGSEPTWLTIEDLNADGHPDLVVASRSSGSVSVHLGNGGGTFSPKTEYATGDLPIAVAVGDMNADGKPDLVVASARRDGSVSVLLGNGDGTFGGRTDFDGGESRSAVAIGDLNRDGSLDVVTLGASGPRGTILLGRGDGTLGSKTEYLTGGLSDFNAIGDLNADGKLDLVTANVTSKAPSTVSVLLGNGDGTFGTRTDTPAGEGVKAVAIAELNGDGSPDLAVTNVNTVSILLGKGDGSLEPASAFATGPDPNQVAAGDLNGDGKTDLVTASSRYEYHFVSVLLGNGDGTFRANTDYEVANAAMAVAIADLNGDGKLDLAVAAPGGSAKPVAVLLGNGDGTFQARVESGSGVDGPIAIADLNGDAKPDIVASNYGSNAVTVLLGNGDGSFGAGTEFGTGPLPWIVAIGDLNADGKLDLASANAGSNTVSVLLGNGDGTFGARTDYVTGDEPHWTAIADLNADGKLDLAVANSQTSTVSVFLGNGDGTFGAKTDYGTGGVPWGLAIGDLNHDGKPEIVTANSGSKTVTVLRNLGPSAPSQPSARAFVNGNRTIPLEGRTPKLRVQIEPIGRSFEPSEVDFSTLSMISEGTGSVSRISAMTSKPSYVGDTDRNGVAELSVNFAGEDLAQLFSSIHDRQDVEVTIQGNLGTGGAFAAKLQLTVKGKHQNSRRLAASFAPNPMNPSGVLKLTTRIRGTVTVRLFDLSGRLVRTVARGQTFEAGDHEFALDGRDDRGAVLATGVYFYKVESSDGMTSGRFAIAK